MKPIRIIIHHSSAEDSFSTIEEWHKHIWNFKSSLGFYCGYTHVIEQDGKVIQARTDTEEQAHCKGFNQDSIGICLCGNLNERRPSLAQLVALKGLINQKMEGYAIPPKNIVGHRMLSTTSCPGKLLTELELKEMFIPSLSYIQSLIVKLKEILNKIKLQLLLKLGGQEVGDGRD